ncbi:complement C1q tumor necrosis factor-related protein 4-like [Ptychodera flava]|uniref:complement C1q tumor necrosis factor-related protein 4-like n=1 Tax=Ptychodera flava TaxID=63121 RepID=UPI00396A724C
MTNIFIYLLTVSIVASVPSSGSNDSMTELLRQLRQLEARYGELRRENAELRSVVTTQQRIEDEYSDEASNFQSDLRNEDDDKTNPSQRKRFLASEIQQLKDKQTTLEKRLSQLSDDLSNMTKKCAFSAVRTREMFGDDSQTQVITYNELHKTEGNFFDIKTGIFTCEVSGFFYFSFNVRSYSRYSNHSIGISLMKNGHVAVSMQTDEDIECRDGHFRSIMQSQSVMLELVAGDKVWLVLGQNSNYGITSHTHAKYITFNGFLV